ncbi:hypothetical protein GCM10022286_00330 [Gryllotalpicola daejeonensis]|uniref:Uncharacterized protein n=1 Tax=Gryllotalpicola daejeonensis TaxID=993087 RepID=A0ABP7ZCV9_9MICO
MTVQTIHSIYDVHELIGLVNRPTRQKSLVLVSETENGAIPYNAERIDLETGTRADVFTIDFKTAFLLSDEVGKTYSAFGGATRIYPRGFSMRDAATTSELFLPGFDSDSTRRREDALIHLALRGSYLPGRPEQRPAIAPVEDEVTRLRRQLAEARAADDARVRDLLVENARLRAAAVERRTATAARKARPTTGAAAPFEPERFNNADDAARHAILNAWVQRVEAREKELYPLPAYELGDAFARSLAEFDPEQQGKALRAAVDVLTGRAKDVRGRRLHQLRDGDAGPARVREDGATCWRVDIETNTPSARRLHYWQRADGVIELSKVGLHDDYRA